MNNKPLAYIGLSLVLAGFLSFIGIFAMGNNVGSEIRDGVALGAIAVCFAGSVVGLLNWKAAPGKVGACFGGTLIVLYLAWCVVVSFLPVY